MPTALTSIFKEIFIGSVNNDLLRKYYWSMKKLFTKIKISLATLRITIISFFPKVIGQNGWPEPRYQPVYWVIKSFDLVEPEPSKLSIIISTIIKIGPRLLIAITFIVWIVSFIRIRKTDDKDIKKKKIKKTIIIISLLAILIISTLLLLRFLNR